MAILLKGGCDIDGISFYLRGRFIKESSILINESKRVYYSCHSDILNILLNNKSFVSPFLPKALIESRIFDKEIDTVIISIIAECGLNTYSDENRKIKIPFGEANINILQDFDSYQKIEFSDNTIDKKSYYKFCKDYKCNGRVNPKNGVSVFLNLVKSFPYKKFIFILGPEICYENIEECGPYKDALTYYKEYNALLIKSLCELNNVSFINPNNAIKRSKNRKALFFRNYPSCVHYKRYTYFLIAKELSHMVKNIKITLKYEIIRKFKKFLTKFVI